MHRSATRGTTGGANNWDYAYGPDFDAAAVFVPTAATSSFLHRRRGLRAQHHRTPWALNRRFLDLIARSGTALFVSVDATTRTDAVDADLSVALRLALAGGDPSGVEPIDWLTITYQRSGAPVGPRSATTGWRARGADPFEQFTSA